MEAVVEDGWVDRWEPWRHGIGDVGCGMWDGREYGVQCIHE